MDATVSQGNESSNKSLIDLSDDHSLPPMESNPQTSAEKEIDFEKTATDDFEHIQADNPSCATSSPSAMSNLENFMTDLSFGMKTSNADKLTSTKDFIENEKQIQGHHHIGNEANEGFGFRRYSTQRSEQNSLSGCQKKFAGRQ